MMKRTICQQPQRMMVVGGGDRSIGRHDRRQNHKGRGHTDETMKSTKKGGVGSKMSKLPFLKKTKATYRP